jgi:hypothetical protein
VAKELGETGLNFLVHPELNDAEMQETCRAVESVMQEATKTSLPAELVQQTSYIALLRSLYQHSHI